MMRSLEPSIKKIWTLKFALFWGILFFSALIFEFYSYFSNSDFFLPTGILSGICLLIGVPVTLYIPRLSYKYWRFDLRSEELYLERGILNRVRTIVPLRRIQHLDVSQNVLEREYNLSKLIVHTAGSRSSDVVLPGLRFDEAEQLRDDVKRYILEDAI